MALVNPDGTYSLLGIGAHNQRTIRGLTGSVIHDGDRIIDAFGNTWVILKSYPVPWGNVVTHYEADLSLLADGTAGGLPGVPPGVTIGSSIPAILRDPLTAKLELNTPVVIPDILTAKLELNTPVVIPDILTAKLELNTPIILSESTIVSIVPDVPRWFIDCAWSAFGTFSPAGFQTVASGATLPVSSTSDIANGYVYASATPFSFDNGAFSLGAVDSAGAGSYTVPAQTNNTWHQLRGSYAVGWGVYCTGTTSDGYHAVGSAATYAATRSGSNTKWYLDTILVYEGTAYTVPAQTNGTYHTLTCTT